MVYHQNLSDHAVDDTKAFDDSLVIEEYGSSLLANAECLEKATQTLLDSIVRLYRAHLYSIECNRSPWEFAIELQQLQRTGITAEEIRWLIGKSFVEHAEEVTERGRSKREFQPQVGFRLTDASCFILSEHGVGAARYVMELIHKRDPADDPVSETETELKPRWDTVRHELRLGKVLVKKFKWRAANQEAILNAFQEDGWPAHIDDPLTQIKDMNPKRRLSDAIKCLNRKQKNPLVRFSGDGTGEGVLWEIVEQESE